MPRALGLLLLVLACGKASTPPSETPSPTPAPAPTPTPVPDPIPDVPPAVRVADGEDWSLPDDTTPAENAGFYSESAYPNYDVAVRVVDVTWAMLEPADDAWATDRRGSAQGMDFASFDDQMADGDRYWLRIWTSAVDWAPPWVAAKCGVSPITGQDYDGQEHLPIWDPCMWAEIVALYDEFLVGRGLAADPDLVLAYVPGAFTWTEFDFDMINAAEARDGLTFATFDTWFSQMTTDLVGLAGPDAHKLVFTGEDYPYGPFGEKDDLCAFDAVSAGMGIRNGISEVFNNHLSEVPAYGTAIAPDGHLVTDDDWPLIADPARIIGAENECFASCGFDLADPAYAVKLANLKVLQLRTNWLYVVPGPSFLDEYPELWAWTALELGRRAADAPDAWVALRDAEDRYWTDEDTGPDGTRWDGFPYVKNLERWLVQRDVAPDGISARGSEVHVGEVDPYNGTSYEGRRTDHAQGSDWLYFDLDDRFATAGTLELKVTFVDSATATWSLEYATAAGPRTAPPVTNGGTGALRTATFTLSDAVFDGSFSGATDFRIWNGGEEDVEVQFVRLIRGTTD